MLTEHTNSICVIIILPSETYEREPGVVFLVLVLVLVVSYLKTCLYVLYVYIAGNLF